MQQDDSRRSHAALERTRDWAFEATGLAGHVADPQWEIKVLLRISDVLDRCGDHDDAVELQSRAMRLMYGARDAWRCRRLRRFRRAASTGASATPVCVPARDHLLRRAGHHHAPALAAAFGPEVDDPVGLGDHVQVVLDHDHAVAAVDQPVQHADQLLHVGHVQADGRLVQHVQRVRRLLAAARDVVAHLAQFGHQLDALRLAAAQRRRRLAQRQVAQAHVLQQLQRVGDGRHRGEELDRLVDLHLQHVADALAAPADGQRLGVEALAVADVAGHLHVGQEAHLDGAQALALRSCGSGRRRC